MKRRGWHLGREQTRRLMRKAGAPRCAAWKPVFHRGCRSPRGPARRPGTRDFKAPMPTGCGSPASRSYALGRGSAKPRSAPTPVPRRSPAGLPRPPSAPKTLPCRISITLCDSRLPICPSSFIIPTFDRSTFRFPIPTDWPNSASHRRSGHEPYSCEDTLAEALNAAYKSELINRGRPWRCMDGVELATAEWEARYDQ